MKLPCFSRKALYRKLCLKKCKHFLNLARGRRTYGNVDKKTHIQNLYFNEEKTLTEIAKELNTSVSYISKILRTNKMYLIEKEKRKRENLSKRRIKQKEIIYKNRKNKEKDLSYYELKSAHEQASKELSKSRKLGTEAIRKWCGTSYKYNKKKNRYEFQEDKSLRSLDLPKYIKA